MKKNILILIGCILSLLITFYYYKELPNQIPLHWNIKGEIDNYGSKPFIFLTALLPFIMIILKQILPKIDPKSENYSKHKKSYNITFNAIIVFFILIHQSILFYSLGYNINIPATIKVLIGILFIIIGNYMSQVRQNFFYGVKTPWTLSDEIVWKKTHRLGGFLFVFSGLIFIISSFIKNTFLTYFTITIIILSVIFPILYSYILYKKKENNIKNG